MSLTLPDQPFVGLRPFNSHENLLFFGRELQTVALLQRLHRSRFLAVVGSSGSGKSSLVRAGLIPKLEAGFLVEERDRWTIARMKPGNAPLLRLAQAITGCGNMKVVPEEASGLAADIRHRGVRSILERFDECDPDRDTNFLVLVDQFEEVFRFGEDPDRAQPGLEASDLVSLMLELARQRVVPVYVALTMRSDFLGNCDAFFGLPEVINEAQYLIPRLTREQLREAVLGPIRLFGASMTPRLADRLLNDVGDTSDALPMFQHALLRLWSYWTQTDGQGPIDLASYEAEAVGTLERALSNHAEEALVGMSPVELDRTMRLFQALTEVDAANRFVRHPATVGELAAICGASLDDVQAIVARFQQPDRSFLTVSDSAVSADSLVDISHESLIRHWVRLRGWVEAEAASAKIYRRLAETAALHTRGKAALFRGPDLEIALEWEKQQQPQPAWARRYDAGFDLALTFLRQSATADRAERIAQDQQRSAELRRTRKVAGVLVVLFGIAIIAASLAFSAQRRAERLQREAETVGRRAQTEQLRAEAALVQNVKVLQVQLASNDTALVVSAIEQLFKIHHVEVSEIFAWIPAETLRSKQWLGSVALELGERGDYADREWVAKTRAMLPEFEAR